MSTTTELAELRQLIGGLQRCAASLKSKYGDSPATRRIVNDAERILNDVERLDIDAGELGQLVNAAQKKHSEKIGVPDTQYDREFWHGVDDEGLGGTR